jgi:hypothetical protein
MSFNRYNYSLGFNINLKVETFLFIKKTYSRGSYKDKASLHHFKTKIYSKRIYVYVIKLVVGINVYSLSVKFKCILWKTATIVTGYTGLVLKN